MKFCGRLDKNPQLSIRNIHDKKASEKLIIVYALHLSCTIKKNAIFTFRRLSRNSAADFPCGISKKLRMRSKTFTQCASISAPFWKILQISPHLLTQFSHASLALPTATFLFYRGNNPQSQRAGRQKSNGGAPASNSQPPHAMRKVFSAKLEADYSSANLVLKNLGIWSCRILDLKNMHPHYGYIGLARIGSQIYRRKL